MLRSPKFLFNFETYFRQGTSTFNEGNRDYSKGLFRDYSKLMWSLPVATLQEQWSNVAGPQKLKSSQLKELPNINNVSWALPERAISIIKGKQQWNQTSRHFVFGKLSRHFHRTSFLFKYERDTCVIHQPERRKYGNLKMKLKVKRVI